MPEEQEGRVKRRNMIGAMSVLGVLALAGCDGNTNQAQLALPTKVTLGITPELFVQKYNDSVPVVLDALLDNDAYARRSLGKLYVIQRHTVSKGNTNSVFKAVSGPKNTPVFGTATGNGELGNVGVSLGDNTDDARSDFLLIATMIGHALTGAPPPAIRKRMLRLLLTLVDNPEQVVAEGIGQVLFTATLSKTGIAIQAEHKQ